MAKVEPKDIDLCELHDAFSILELVNMEDIGLAEPGKAIAMVKEGLREGTRVIVGGAAVTDKTSKDHKADAYAPNAQDAVRTINSWVHA